MCVDKAWHHQFAGTVDDLVARLWIQPTADFTDQVVFDQKITIFENLVLFVQGHDERIFE